MKIKEILLEAEVKTHDNIDCNGNIINQEAQNIVLYFPDDTKIEIMKDFQTQQSEWLLEKIVNYLIDNELINE